MIKLCVAGLLCGPVILVLILSGALEGASWQNPSWIFAFISGAIIGWVTYGWFERFVSYLSKKVESWYETNNHHA
jgi:hypothetical protein